VAWIADDVVDDAVAEITEKNGEWGPLNRG
jgi:hypothetical protein